MAVIKSRKKVLFFTLPFWRLSNHNNEIRIKIIKIISRNLAKHLIGLLYWIDIHCYYGLMNFNVGMLHWYSLVFMIDTFSFRWTYSIEIKKWNKLNTFCTGNQILCKDDSIKRMQSLNFVAKFCGSKWIYQSVMYICSDQRHLNEFILKSNSDIDEMYTYSESDTRFYATSIQFDKLHKWSGRNM